MKRSTIVFIWRANRRRCFSSEARQMFFWPQRLTVQKPRRLKRRLRVRNLGHVWYMMKIVTFPDLLCWKKYAMWSNTTWKSTNYSPKKSQSYCSNYFSYCRKNSRLLIWHINKTEKYRQYFWLLKYKTGVNISDCMLGKKGRLVFFCFGLCSPLMCTKLCCLGMNNIIGNITKVPKIMTWLAMERVQTCLHS